MIFNEDDVYNSKVFKPTQSQGQVFSMMPLRIQPKLDSRRRPRVASLSSNSSSQSGAECLASTMNLIVYRIESERTQ